MGKLFYGIMFLLSSALLMSAAYMFFEADNNLSRASAIGAGVMNIVYMNTFWKRVMK